MWGSGEDLGPAALRGAHARLALARWLHGKRPLLVIVVGTALAFDFTNGFHDTANAMATSIATRRAAAAGRRRALRGAQRRRRVPLAGVAATIAKGIVDPSAITLNDRLRRPDRRDRLEPRHLVLRPALELVARADRRGGRRDAGRGGHRTAIKGAGIVEKVLIPAVLAPFLAGAGRAASAPTWSTASPAASGPTTSTRGFRYGQIAHAPRWSRSRTARTTRRRRWA